MLEEPKFPKPEDYKLPVDIEQEFDVKATRAQLVKALYATHELAKEPKGREINGVSKSPITFEIEPPGLGTTRLRGTKWTQDSKEHHAIVVFASNDYVSLLHSVHVTEGKVKYRVSVKTREMTNLRAAASIRVKIKQIHDALLKELE